MLILIAGTNQFENLSRIKVCSTKSIKLLIQNNENKFINYLKNLILFLFCFYSK